MKTKVILSALYITVFSMTSNAQSNLTGQNNVWHIGISNNQSYFRLDFTGETPVAEPSEHGSSGWYTLRYYESVSVVTDQYGNEKMYSDGVEIYDASHSLMYGAPPALSGTQSTINGASTQGALSVTDRNNLDIIHFFTANAIDGYPNGLRYHKIDLSLTGNGTTENPLGEVVEYDFVLDSSSTEMLTSFGSCESDSVWVVGHKRNSYDFIIILIDENGVSVKTQNVPTPAKNGSILESVGRGSMDFSPDGFKLAMIGSYPTGTHIMDFDFETGQLSNPIELLRSFPSNPRLLSSFSGYDVEFSPDGSKLYATDFMAGSLVQFDLEEETSYTFADSLNPSSIEKGPDGTIYFAKDYNVSSLSLGKIENANNSATGNINPATVINDAIVFPSLVNSDRVTYALPQDNICYNNTITSTKSMLKTSPGNLYPNPAVNYVYNTSGKELVFYNALGSQVLKSTETKINVSNLVEGVYFVKGSGNVTRLVVRK